MYIASSRENFVNKLQPNFQPIYQNNLASCLVLDQREACLSSIMFGTLTQPHSTHVSRVNVPLPPVLALQKYGSLHKGLLHRLHAVKHHESKVGNLSRETHRIVSAPVWRISDKDLSVFLFLFRYEHIRL